MTPEAKARQLIDAKLVAAGWAVQDMKAVDLSATAGVGVREYPTDTGPVDYVLFVGRGACGVIEAKNDVAGEHLAAALSVRRHRQRAAGAHPRRARDAGPGSQAARAQGRGDAMTNIGYLDMRPKFALSLKEPSC